MSDNPPAGDDLGVIKRSQLVAVIALAKRDGYAKAIELLRDSQAYMVWVRDGQRAGTQQHRSAWGTSDVMWAADYLEALADAIYPKETHDGQ